MTGHSPDAMVQRHVAEKRVASKNYASRLRDDADRLSEELDFENAIVRLDQSAAEDPQGDQTPDMKRFRRELLEAIVNFDALAHATTSAPAASGSSPTLRPPRRTPNRSGAVGPIPSASAAADSPLAHVVPSIP
jgi:hypothetical protein